MNVLKLILIALSILLTQEQYDYVVAKYFSIDAESVAQYEEYQAEQNKVEVQEPQEPIEQPIVQEPVVETKRVGDYGNLSIPDIGCNVGLHYGNGPSESQKITNDPNLAFYWPNTSYCWYVADHNNQQFANLKNVVVGTKAYINDDEYVCVIVDLNGYADPWIHMSDGSAPDYYYTNSDCVVMYTCKNGTDTRVVTIWVKN